jgi:hypothetical protein
MMNGRLGICGQAGMVHARRGSVSSVGTTSEIHVVVVFVRIQSLKQLIDLELVVRQ